MESRPAWAGRTVGKRGLSQIVRRTSLAGYQSHLLARRWSLQAIVSEVGSLKLAWRGWSALFIWGEEL